jgi:hypothetical protein
MHCADVIEELAVSTEPASAALAEHLARCPDCATWFERNARLSQLWEATRPQEPTPAAWAVVWADLAQKLATPPAPVLPLAPMRPWQRWAAATFGIAQAAALLAGAVWLGSQPSPTPVASATGTVAIGDPGPLTSQPSPTPVAGAMVEIPASDGALVMIQSVGKDLKIVSLVTDEGSSTVDREGFGALVEPNFVMLGKLESMAVAE